MYLHLGQGVVTPEKSIVGIFDLEICSQSKHTRAFLAQAEREGQVVSVSPEDLPKSFTVTRLGDKKRIFVSPLSSLTLQKRAETPESDPAETAEP